MAGQIEAGRRHVIVLPEPASFAAAAVVVL